MASQANQLAHPKTTIHRGAFRKTARLFFLYLVCSSLGAMFMFPFFYTFMSSLKSPWEMYTFPPTMIPESLQWVNYATAVTMVPFGRWVYNTILVVFLATVGGLITASPVAFSFARFKYRFRDALFIVTLSTMMLPAQVTLIPRYILFFQLGRWTGFPFINTIRPLWIPSWFGGGAFAIFLLRQFIMTIPKDLDEAALIDGASYPRIFLTIVMPLCKPVIATLAIISLIGHWNSFMEPLIYINDPIKFTISVGLRYFQRAVEAYVIGEPQEQFLMAGSVLSMILPITVFFMAQQYFVRGIVMSGIKG